MAEECREFYETVLSYLTQDKTFVKNLIERADRVFRETRGSPVSLFDSEKIANGILVILFNSVMMDFLRDFNFPTVDFQYLKEGLKSLIQENILQIKREKEVKNAANEK